MCLASCHVALIAGSLSPFWIKSFSPPKTAIVQTLCSNNLLPTLNLLVSSLPFVITFNRLPSLVQISHQAVMRYKTQSTILEQSVLKE